MLLRIATAFIAAAAAAAAVAAVAAGSTSVVPRKTEVGKLKVQRVLGQ